MTLLVDVLPDDDDSVWWYYYFDSTWRVPMIQIWKNLHVCVVLLRNVYYWKIYSIFLIDVPKMMIMMILLGSRRRSSQKMRTYDDDDDDFDWPYRLDGMILSLDFWDLFSGDCWLSETYWKVVLLEWDF